MRSAILIAMAVICFAPPVQGQFADVSQAGEPETINAAWRFHTGDDLQWALPVFDDSLWSLLRIDKNWASQGYKGCYGYAWYRVKLKLPASRVPLALAFQAINSADEIYANGQLIGTIGKMRPAPRWLGYSPFIHSFPLPVALNGQIIELAIRVWQPQASSNDYAYVGRALVPRVGAVQTIANFHTLSITGSMLTQLPAWIVGAVGAGIGLCSLGLFSFASAPPSMPGPLFSCSTEQR